MEYKRRLQWLDFARGGGILLVILGHSVQCQIIRGIIFSFHMPLFFALSGYTFTHPESVTQLKKLISSSIRRLLIPASAAFFTRIVLGYYGKNGLTGAITKNLLRLFCTLFWASGVSFTIHGVLIQAIGMLWFLISLLFTRIIYGMITLYFKSYCNIICIFLLGAGFMFSKIIYLPFSFDVTFVSLCFFHLGNQLKQGKIDMNKRNAITAFLIWTSGFFASYLVKDSYLELAARRYPLFPVSIISACCAIYFFIYVSQKIRINNIFGNIFIFCGTWSMVLYMIHSFDFLWNGLYGNLSGTILYPVIRILVDCTICYCYVRAQYAIRTYLALKN